MPAQWPRGMMPPMGGQGSTWGATRGWRPRVVFRSPKCYANFTVSGVTKDSAGAALGACDVHLFESGTDLEVAQTVSDGSGVYTFRIGNNAGFFYVTAYKAGAPDVAGTTVNTLVAT